MNKVVIIVDELHELTKELLDKYDNVKLISYCIGNSYLSTEKIIEEFRQLCKELKNKNYDFCILISSYAFSDDLFSNMDLKLYYINNFNCSFYYLEKLIQLANELIKEDNFKMEEIIYKLTEYSLNVETYHPRLKIRYKRPRSRTRKSLFEAATSADGTYFAKSSRLIKEETLEQFDYLLLNDINEGLITEVVISYNRKRKKIVFDIKKELNIKYPSIDFILEEYPELLYGFGGIGLFFSSFLNTKFENKMMEREKRK